MSRSMHDGNSGPPIISIVGYSGVGKTTFLEKLLPELTQSGLTVGTIKHHHSTFDMDRPGKDSWRHKKAGASVAVIASPHQIGVMMDVDHDYHPDEFMPFLRNVDIVLAEGYKRGTKPKVEIFRPEVYGNPLCKDDDQLIAIVSDASIDLNVPCFALNDARGLADFLIHCFNLVPAC